MFYLTFLNLVTQDIIHLKKYLMLKTLNPSQKWKTLHYMMVLHVFPCLEEISNNPLASQWPAACPSNSQHLLRISALETRPPNLK